MARAPGESNSLRFGRRESARVIVALLVSLAVHLGAGGTYLLGNKFGVWHMLHLPAWMQPAAKKKPPAPVVQADETEPATYVDVSHADADAPTVAQYYSSKNSHAANRQTGRLKVPKINGAQTFVPKTEDVPRSPKKIAPAPPGEPSKTESAEDAANQFAKLQPSMPRPTPMRSDTPAPPQTPGETDARQPANSLPEAIHPPVPSPAEAQRPRTLRQALAQRDQLPGPAMQEDGGVQKRAMSSSLDAKATPFGEYDGAIIGAVQQRWYDLLDSRRFAQDRTGRVTLRFKIMSDGSVIEMQTVENGVGELLGYLCQEAIEEAAPFAKWPPDMVRMIGTNYRVVTFTFFYY